MPTQPTFFQPPSDEIPKILLPDPARIFLIRAERFDLLAENHSLGEWLAFLGRLSRAQHQALQDMTEVALPDQDALELASAHAIPPISVASFKLPPAWRDVLRQFANDLLPDAPVGARDTLDSLLVTSTEELQRLGEMLLTGEPKSLEDMTRLPFIAAALQVVFTGLASQLDASKMPLMEARSVCPCCGSLPVVSVIRADGPAGNPRYAHCTLCNTEWNIPRATCVACGEEEKLALHEIDGDDGIARAESCEACHSYLKIIYQSKGAIVDPIADDLASVALDMLVDDAGFERSGPNLLLIGVGGDNVDLK